MKFIFILFFICIELFAQTFEIKGLVKDSISKEPLKSANIFLIESNIGTITNDFGEFIISNIPAGNYTLRTTYVGFGANEISIKLNSDQFIEIYLTNKPILLSGALVHGTIPKFRETAVAFSELSNKDIDFRLGTKEAVNIVEGTPSAYISQQGSGVGEQRLNLRGFDQTNIAVMLNGFPINNPENGEVYWSNWAGISDLIQSVYVQRGLSAIPYSTASIGGSVNFITNGFNTLGNSVKIKTEFGSNNLKKNSIGFSTQLSNNIQFTGFISKRNLDGYADQVYSDEFTYYFSLGLNFTNQTLQIQLFGSPQKHGQRLTQLSIDDWNNYGKKFNADWGYLNGKPLNLRDNEFHNPSLNINHNWQLSNNFYWSNILSLSHGTGGGTVPPFYPFLSRTESGLIDFDKEWKINTNNVDANFDPAKNKSVIALRKGVHKNYWGSLISVLKYNWESFVLSLGIDGKLYEAENYNELKNLLGGDYQIGSNNINVDPNRLLLIGDKVDFYAKSFTRGYGTFAQLEYKKNKFTGYLNLALSNTEYNRIDYFNYLQSDPKRETGWKSFTNSTIKTGINYNISNEHNFYLNLGNFSRAPLSFNVYDYSNNLYENVKNENITSIEIGYGFVNSFSKFNVNYYYTLWKDKAFSQSYLNSDSTSIYYYNIFGASARHTGIEFDGTLKVNQNLLFTAMLSYAVNKWTSDVDAYARPESNPNDEIKYHAFTNNLYVGNHPMTTASIGLFYEKEISKNVSFYFNPIYSFYGRYYSQFSPELRTNETDKNIQSWRLPDFYNIDFHAGTEISFENKFIESLKISLNVFNVFDQENIIDATDGLTHDSKSASVWYGRERWWSTSISISF